MLAGRCRLEVPGRREELAAGSIAVIRPGIEHGFSYDGSGSAWISLKVHLIAEPEDPAPLVISSSASVAALVLALRGALGAPAPALEGIATALVWSVWPGCGAAGAGAPPLVDAAIAVIRGAGGRRMSVESVALACGVSSNHLTTAFRRHGLGSPKTAIDRARADRALQLLSHSGLSIEEIAEYLDFPEVFSFSRFIHRLSGHPPGWFRSPHRRGAGRRPE